MAQRPLPPNVTRDALRKMNRKARLDYQRWSANGHSPIDGPAPMNRLYLACYNRGNSPIWKLLLCTPQSDAAAMGTLFGIVPAPNWEFRVETATAPPYTRVLLTEVNDYYASWLQTHLANVNVSGIRYTQEWVWEAIRYLQDFAGYYGFIRGTDVLERGIREFLARPPYQPGQVATLDFRPAPSEYLA